MKQLSVSVSSNLDRNRHLAFCSFPLSHLFLSVPVTQLSISPRPPTSASVCVSCYRCLSLYLLTSVSVTDYSANRFLIWIQSNNFSTSRTLSSVLLSIATDPRTRQQIAAELAGLGLHFPDPMDSSAPLAAPHICWSVWDFAMSDGHCVDFVPPYL